MNSLEASRVMNVLDEALEGLTLLSYVTADVLDTAEQLRDMLGEDLSSVLVRHRGLVVQHSQGELANPAMTASTLAMVRLLQRSASTGRLKALHMGRSPAMEQVLSVFERLRHHTHTQLARTVEEDASDRAHVAEVRGREERSVADRLQLEQKLRLQRVELAKAMALMQAAEDKARTELHDVQTSTQRAMDDLHGVAGNVLKTDTLNYDHEHTHLMQELMDSRAQLTSLREEHKEQEGGLVKGKKRAQQDVEGAVGEYDADVGAKDEEYGRSKAGYDVIIETLQELTLQYSEMMLERQEHEVQVKTAAAARLALALSSVRRGRAARVIQGLWRNFKAAKEKARKKAKKDAAKKKKK
ncbi:MAG: hypothetical protein WDW36_009466 [Sanguina aurantia]